MVNLIIMSVESSYIKQIDADNSKNNTFGLIEAPTFYPSEEEFKNAYNYIQSISPVGEKYGLVKIVPPATWNPKFALDTGVSIYL